MHKSRALKLKIHPTHTINEITCHKCDVSL